MEDDGAHEASCNDMCESAQPHVGCSLLLKSCSLVTESSNKWAYRSREPNLIGLLRPCEDRDVCIWHKLECTTLGRDRYHHTPSPVDNQACLVHHMEKATNRSSRELPGKALSIVKTVPRVVLLRILPISPLSFLTKIPPGLTKGHTEPTWAP